MPVILAIGKRETDERSVSLRRLGAKDQESLALNEAVDILVREAAGPAT